MNNPRIDKYGDKFYFNDKGQLHREDGPATEYIDGTKEWWINGKKHREDGPAIEWNNGDKDWYLDGKNIECETKTCSKCGTINNGLTLENRIFNCEHCGLTINRDINAAINIKRLGTSLIQKEISELNFLLEAPPFRAG